MDRDGRDMSTGWRKQCMEGVERDRQHYQGDLSRVHRGEKVVLLPLGEWFVHEAAGCDDRA